MDDFGHQVDISHDMQSASDFYLQGKIGAMIATSSTMACKAALKYSIQ